MTGSSNSNTSRENFPGSNQALLEKVYFCLSFKVSELRAYLIFVIFFTPPYFLSCKKYTNKVRKFGTKNFFATKKRKWKFWNTNSHFCISTAILGKEREGWLLLPVPLGHHWVSLVGHRYKVPPFWFGVLLGVLGVFWRTLVYCVLGILVSIIGVFVIGILYLLHLEFELVYLMFSSLKTCIFMFVFPEEIC